MAEGTAKYVEVRTHLAERISRMAPGDQLPTEHELCSEYAVSRITVRRAVDDLVRDGVLVKMQGRGTFISSEDTKPHFRESFSEKVTGFYSRQLQQGRKVETTVLANRIVRNSGAAKALGLNVADEVLELERLRYVKTELQQHSVTYLPATDFRDVLEQDFSHSSLFEYLEREHQVELVRNDLLVRVEEVDEYISKLMNMKTGTCILAFESTVFSSAGPVAYGITRNTAENSEIALSLRNMPKFG